MPADMAPGRNAGRLVWRLRGDGMSDRNQSHQGFLGRQYFDDRTMTYTFSDGHGALPVEMRIATEHAANAPSDYGLSIGNGVFVLGEISAWKKRMESQQ